MSYFPSGKDVFDASLHSRNQKIPEGKEITLEGWQPPPEPYMQISCDGACNTIKKVGEFGAIICDSKGIPHGFAFYTSDPIKTVYVPSSQFYDLLRAHLGFTLALKMGKYHVQLAMDSSQVLRMIRQGMLPLESGYKDVSAANLSKKEGKRPMSDCMMNMNEDNYVNDKRGEVYLAKRKVLAETRGLLPRFKSIMYSEVKREGNFSADNLTRLSKVIPGGPFLFLQGK